MHFCLHLPGCSQDVGMPVKSSHPLYVNVFALYLSTCADMSAVVRRMSACQTSRRQREPSRCLILPVRHKQKHQQGKLAQPLKKLPLHLQAQGPCLLAAPHYLPR